MVGVIATRELRGLFLSPLAWVVLAVVQFSLASIFFRLLADFIDNRAGPMTVMGGAGLTETVVSPLLGYAGVVLLFATPMLTSRIISEERRQGTLTLLFAAPVSMSEIVFGKYLGLLAFFLIMVAMTAAMPLSLLVAGHLDSGAFAAAILGLMLLLGSFAAVGLFLSSLTKHPTVAAISSFGILWWLWIIDWAGKSESLRGVFSYLSMGNHFVSLLKGKFDSVDVMYYLLVTGLFLALTVWRLDAERVQR